jgi:hypothetical protein
MLPPEVKAAESEEQGGLPPEVTATLQAAQQEIQGLQQQLQQATQGLQAEKLRSATQIRIAEINADSRQDVEELKGMVQLLIQQMQPPPMLADAVREDLTEEMNQGPEQGPFPLPQ